MDDLLSRAGEALSDNDRYFIHRISGRHPFLAQALAAAMLETTGNDRHAHACRRFYTWVSHYFDELWHRLDGRARTIVTFLSLVELGSRARGHDFDYVGIQRKGTLGAALRNLRNLGLSEPVRTDWPFDVQYLFPWEEERWTIGAFAFAWWVCDGVVAGTLTLSPHSDWLIINGGISDQATHEASGKEKERQTELRQILVTHFDEGELRTLCSDLGIDYEDLPCKGKANKCRELVAYLKRHDSISELVRIGKQRRPDISWNDINEAIKFQSPPPSPLRYSYRSLLPQELWDDLVSALRDAPGWATRGIGALAQELFKELVQVKRE